MAISKPLLQTLEETKVEMNMSKELTKEMWPDFLGHDRLVDLLDIQLEDMQEGYARASLVVAEKHLNGLGCTQGGAIFTLADYAFAAACNSWGSPAMGLQVSISYLKATQKGAKLTAICQVDHQGGRIGAYTTEIRDETGALIAKCTSTSCRVHREHK
jgi:acyl-CoA thioesterase